MHTKQCYSIDRSSNICWYWPWAPSAHSIHIWVVTHRWQSTPTSSSRTQWWKALLQQHSRRPLIIVRPLSTWLLWVFRFQNVMSATSRSRLMAQFPTVSLYRSHVLRRSYCWYWDCGDTHSFSTMSTQKKVLNDRLARLYGIIHQSSGQWSPSNIALIKEAISVSPPYI